MRISESTADDLCHFVPLYLFLFYSIRSPLLHLFPTCLLPLGASIPMADGRKGKIEEEAICGNIHHVCMCYMYMPVCVHACAQT